MSTSHTPPIEFTRKLSIFLSRSGTNLEGCSVMTFDVVADSGRASCVSSALDVPKHGTAQTQSRQKNGAFKSIEECSAGAHLDLEASDSVGMHFGTFQMTTEGINEPLRALDEA